jgi:multiple sugar transport system permease protein/putative aldouronate transport system permease protein
MYGAQIAFRDYNPGIGILNSSWVGFKHIQNFLDSFLFWRIMYNTLGISFYGLLVFPVPVLLAILITYNPSRRFRKSLQMITYFPYFISTVVMVGLVLQFLSIRNGPINMFLGLFGAQPIDFMGDPKKFWSVYTWSDVWQGMGYNSVIFIAALSSVDISQHEAAIVDGANIFRRIRHIDLPSIMPTIIILLILRFGTIMDLGFEKILLMQNTLNLTASEIVGTYVYKQGIASTLANYSYTTAIGLFISIINLILLATVNKVSRFLSGSSLW